MKSITHIILTITFITSLYIFLTITNHQKEAQQSLNNNNDDGVTITNHLQNDDIVVIRRLQDNMPTNSEEDSQEDPDDADDENNLEAPPAIQNPAVVTLVTNDEDDLDDLCIMLKSLLFLKGGYGGSFVRGGPTGIFSLSPVLVFNEGNLSLMQMQKLESCSSRRVAFPVAYINTYPPGFDPDYEWKGFERWTKFRPLESRRNWSYSQMIRFWTTTIWTHPAVQQFDTIMKMDSDACFLRQRYNHFNPLYQEAPGLGVDFVYQTNYDGNMGGNRFFAQGLYELAVEHMKTNNLSPSNPELWDLINSTWHEHYNLPVFQTNFEIARRSFFQRRDVTKWHEALTETEPYGIFRKRWSDAMTRVFTMAIFAKKDEVMLSKTVGFLHGIRRCKESKVEDAHLRVATDNHY